jgi:hypothetical protein
VFNALLAGVIGMHPAGGPSSHKQLLGSIKNFIKHKDLLGVTVSGPFSHHRLLSAKELGVCRVTVEALHVGDGYLCAAEDPLLILAARAFQVNIVHDFVGNTFEFQVPEPRRTVFLASSVRHMAHVANVEL